MRQVLISIVLAYPLLAQVNSSTVIEIGAYGYDNSGVAQSIARLGTSGKILQFPIANYTATTQPNMTGKSDFVAIGSPIPYILGLNGTYSGPGTMSGHVGNIKSGLWVDTKATRINPERVFGIVGSVHANIDSWDIVGVYGSADLQRGNGASTSAFGGNFLAQIDAGATATGVIGTEFDVNNNLRPLTGLGDTLNPVGVQVFSGGLYGGKYAHVIGATSVANRWMGGIWFTPTSVSDYAIDMTSLPSSILYPVRYRNNQGPASTNTANTKLHTLVTVDTLDRISLNPSYASAALAADVVIGIGLGRSAAFVNPGEEQVLRMDGTGRLELPKQSSYAELGSPLNSAFVYCADCSVSIPCSGNGAGAWAFYSKSTWKCPF
jgi:hypothetical protein